MKSVNEGTKQCMDEIQIWKYIRREKTGVKYLLAKNVEQR